MHGMLLPLIMTCCCPTISLACLLCPSCSACILPSCVHLWGIIVPRLASMDLVHLWGIIVPRLASMDLVQSIDAICRGSSCLMATLSVYRLLALRSFSRILRACLSLLDCRNASLSIGARWKLPEARNLLRLRCLALFGALGLSPC